MHRSVAVAHHAPSDQKLRRGARVSKGVGEKSHSKNPSKDAPSQKAPSSTQSTPSPSKQTPSEAWGLPGVDENYAIEQVEHYKRDAIEAILSKQQRDMHIMIAEHHDQQLSLLRKADEAATEAISENTRLRAAIAELKRKSNDVHVRAVNSQPFLGCVHCGTRQLMEKELKRTQGILFQRDESARSAEAENIELREQLQQLTTRRSVQMDDGIEEMTLQDSKDEMFQTTTSFWTTADTAMTTNHASRKPAHPAAGFDLLGELRLPGQQYDDREGNFFEDPEDLDSEQNHPLPDDIKIQGSSKKKNIKKKAGNSLLDARSKVQKLFTDKITGYDVLKKDGWCQACVKSPIFDNLSTLVILMNVVWIGVDTLINDADLLLDADLPIIFLENAFCIFFAVELGIRWGAYKTTIDALRDRWILFDLILVGMMIFETWIMVLVALVTDSAGFDMREASILRILRLVRLFKVTRIIRVLHSVPEIMILVKALAVASRTVFFTMCLLASVIYTFSIAFTQMSRGMSVHEVYFLDLWSSAFTLLFNGCLGDGLTELAVKCYSDSWLLAVLLSIYFLIAPMTVLNMVIAVMVEVVSQVATAERETMASAYVRDTIKEVLRDLDGEHNHLISMREFAHLVDNKEALEALSDVGLDVIQLVEEPDLIFGKYGGELTYNEFCEEILLLRVNNTATLKDLVQMRKHINDDLKRLLDRQAKSLKGRNSAYLVKGAT